MNSTPQSLRKHVAIFGNTNAGKSALFNAILKQNIALVSEQAGTTADPVIKSVEILPYGPVTLIDTAGLDDQTSLGDLRVEKTKSIIDRTDYAIYAADINQFSPKHYKDMHKELDSRDIPHSLVFTKCDMAASATISAMKNIYLNSIFVSSLDQKSIDKMLIKISEQLSNLKDNEESLLGGLASKGDVIVCVTPIDSEAPVGRLILPQVQTIRDAQDKEVICVVTQVSTLSQIIENYSNIKLVITDSQVFAQVAEIVPESIALTSFSMLFARQKGDLQAFVSGANAIDFLQDNDKILIAESCTHTNSHEDIGQIKIPKLLQKYTGKSLQFEFSAHHDFAEDLSEYALVIHCGGCMINKKAITNRIDSASVAGVPITNYGVILAKINGILERCMKAL